MNFSRKFTVHTGSRAGKLFGGLLALFVLEFGWVAAAPVSTESDTLSIQITVPRDAAGILTLPHGEAFEVVITNHSNEPQKIWEEKCLPGSRSLTFRVENGAGDLSIVQKREVSPDVWTRELGYLPATRTIPPKGSETRSVNLSEFFWGERAWQNVPEPNSGEKIQIAAVFEIAPGDEARTMRCDEPIMVLGERSSPSSWSV